MTIKLWNITSAHSQNYGPHNLFKYIRLIISGSGDNVERPNEGTNSNAVYKDDDDTYYWFDDAETITVSNDDTDVDDSPLYQNQEEDPQVQNIMFEEYMKYFL